MPKMQITWLSVYGKGLGTERQQGSNPKALEEEKYVRFCPPPSPRPCVRRKQPKQQQIRCSPGMETVSRNWSMDDALCEADFVFSWITI